MKKGFLVRESPSKGIKGLICGNPHDTYTMDITSYDKYKRAVKNEVPIIDVKELPKVLGTTYE